MTISDAIRKAIDTTALTDLLPKAPDPAAFNPSYRSPARDALDQIGNAHRDLKRANLVPHHGAADRPAPAAITSTADIGRRVRAARKTMGMTQQRFADLAGVGRRFVVDLEAGKPTLELERVLMVCREAGLKLVFLS